MTRGLMGEIERSVLPAGRSARQGPFKVARCHSLGEERTRGMGGISVEAMNG